MAQAHDQVVRTPERPALPVGFSKFHRNRFLNYQLNRAHSLGFADAAELGRAANTIKSARNAADAFALLAASAARDDRLRVAVGYRRLAEFFTSPRSTAKAEAYRRFRASFDEAFGEIARFRQEVPYGPASLPAYRLPAEGASRGTVLVHGGFDSLIEEFLPVWQRISSAGFDVIAFDGPGQGGARVAGVLFDHDWEKAVAAVLDHFSVGSCSIVGISMGGYWALRAAAFEPRIERVVSWPPVYDWLYRLPAPIRGAARVMLRRRRFMTWSVRVRTRLIPTLKHVVDQALYIAGGDEPMDAVDWFLGMNRLHLHSEQVTQDVLLMCGEHDVFQPPVLARAQRAAITNAASVTVRMFTAAENADQHCQMGNLELACEVLTEWLRRPRQQP